MCCTWKINHLGEFFLHIFANQLNLENFKTSSHTRGFSWKMGVRCNWSFAASQTAIRPAFSPFTRASESSLAAQTTTQSSRLRFPGVSCLGGKAKLHFFSEKADGKKNHNGKIFTCYFLLLKKNIVVLAEVFQVILKSYYFIYPEKFQKLILEGGNSLPPSYNNVSWPAHKTPVFFLDCPWSQFCSEPCRIRP